MNERVTLRAAVAAGAETLLHAPLSSHSEEGYLLPRRLDEIAVQASRFVVAVYNRSIVGCAELALRSQLAEGRSLAVEAGAERIGGQLVADLRLRATRAGYQGLCLLTDAAEYFINFHFSIVPHLRLREKVVTDCVSGPKLRRCAQMANVLPREAWAATEPHHAIALLQYA